MFARAIRKHCAHEQITFEYVISVLARIVAHKHARVQFFRLLCRRITYQMVVRVLRNMSQARTFSSDGNQPLIKPFSLMRVHTEKFNSTNKIYK
jgi:hypothetical protein